MDDIYVQLATDVHTAALAKSPGRLLVGIAGPPGSGKSTIADRVVKVINGEPFPSTLCHAQTVPMDGFHYTRRFLDGLPNREEAYLRRGSPWTFDVDAIIEFVTNLFQSANLPAEERPHILAPSFDHAAKDPKEEDITIQPETSIVILDGNYLLLDEEKWRDISKWLDLKIFVNVDARLARERVAKRHVAAGIEPTMAKGQERFDVNDLVNGQLIREKVVSCDVVVESLPAA